MRNSDEDRGAGAPGLDVEPLLTRFRAAGPPPELRARIAGTEGARGFSRAVVEWLPAAAALLLVVLFHWLATTERQLLEARIVPIPPVEAAAIELSAEPQQ